MLQGTILGYAPNASQNTCDQTCQNAYEQTCQNTYEQTAQNTQTQANQQTADNDLNSFTAQFKQMFDTLTENIPNGTHEEKSAKNFFQNFSDYIGSQSFKNSVNEKAEKYNIPPKQVAKNFFLKVLGIIGDVLGIVVNTVCNIVDTAITIMATLLHAGVSIIAKAGNAVTSVITLNQTNVVTA